MRVVSKSSLKSLKMAFSKCSRSHFTKLFWTCFDLFWSVEKEKIKFMVLHLPVMLCPYRSHRDVWTSLQCRYKPTATERNQSRGKSSSYNHHLTSDWLTCYVIHAGEHCFRIPRVIVSSARYKDVCWILKQTICMFEQHCQLVTDSRGKKLIMTSTLLERGSC